MSVVAVFFSAAEGCTVCGQTRGPPAIAASTTISPILRINTFLRPHFELRTYDARAQKRSISGYTVAAGLRCDARPSTLDTRIGRNVPEMRATLSGAGLFRLRKNSFGVWVRIRARLQSCRKLPRIYWALAPEGCIKLRAAGTDYHVDIMKSAAFLIPGLLASSMALHGAINQSCKAGSEDASILHFHGRLSVYNGGYPNLRIWQIGTNHLFGIYSDPADLKCNRGGACNGDEDTELPGNLQHLNLLEFDTYGDFEIRQLEPYKQGHQQAACIINVRKIVRRHRD